MKNKYNLYDEVFRITEDGIKKDIITGIFLDSDDKVLYFLNVKSEVCFHIYGLTIAGFREENLFRTKQELINTL